MVRKKSKRKTGKFKEIAKSVSSQKRALGERVIDLWKQGYSTEYCREVIAKEYTGKPTPSALDDIISVANTLVTNEHATEKEEIVAIDVMRYNEIIYDLIQTVELNKDEIGEFITYEEWMIARGKKIKAYFDCIDTMIQKENILQLHNKQFVFEYHNKLTVEVKEKKERYDINKLSFPEQLEVLQLIMKSRKGDEELMSVIETVKDETQVTEDIAHEVVVPANIEAIQLIQLPAPPKPLVTLVSAKDRLKMALSKMAAKEFEKVGAKLTDQEKELLK